MDAARGGAPHGGTGLAQNPLVRTLGRLLPQGVIVVDPDGRIPWMSPAALEMHGLSPGDVSTLAEYDGRFELRNPRDLTLEANPMALALAGQVVHGAEHQVVPSDGTRAWRARYRASPTRDEHGRPAGAIVLVEDVSDQHHDEEQRRTLYARERLARLAAERERDFVQRIFEAAPIPILLFEGHEHRLAFLNQAARDATGLAAHLDTTHAEALPHDHAAVEPLLARVYAGHEAQAAVEREYRLPARTLLLQSHYVPLPGPDKRPIGVVWLAQDMTGRRDAERALESARRRLTKSERLSTLGALVSGVAHELRTPLAYIANNLALIRSRLERHAPAAAPAVLPHVDEAMDGVDRINRIVGELRRLSETRSLTRTAGLHAIVQPAVDIFRATHTGTVRLALDLHPTGRITGDEHQLHQVVLNLLQNAAEAMPPGGTIEVHTRAEGARAVLTVKDHGAGIPPQAQPHVFDEFYTTKAAGTGLGLAIVKRIVEQHHGSVRFATGPEGTTFRVELPTEKED